MERREPSQAGPTGAADARAHGDPANRGQVDPRAEAAARSQLGLFVIWQNSRREEKRILADLNRLFDVLAVQEVHWSPELVEQNFERFYSDRDVRGVYHVLSKGAGPFLAVTLVDRSPAQEERMTARGHRTVNGRFLDAKLRYREWLGSLGVHCSETTWETRRDLRMLLDVEASSESVASTRWNGKVEVLRRDVTGARGWGSAREVFSALNVSVDYVVIGDSSSPGATSPMDGERPMQLLTAQYHTLHTVLNARPVLGSPPPLGGCFAVSIAGRTVVVGLRVVGDGFLDPRWAGECLATRACGEDGVYRASAQDRFATFCYRAVVQSPCLTTDDKAQMTAMAQSLGLAGWSLAELDDPLRVKERLDDLLRARGISYVRPRDPTVFVNFAALGSRWPRVHRAFGAARRWCYSILNGAVMFGKARYLRTRDRLLRSAPVLRRLKSALAGRQP